MITIGKVIHWKGDRIDILTKCKNQKEASYMFDLFNCMPPPILDFMYNGNLPKKKWDFDEWNAKWQKGMMKRHEETEQVYGESIADQYLDDMMDEHMRPDQETDD